MLNWSVVMLRGNTYPHTAAATQDLIATFGWEQFNHSPYSPDLAPSEFHVFLHLNTFLGFRRFDGDNEVKEAVNTCFALHVVSFYDAWIQNWFPSTTSASTIVETMLKCTVRYVRQMAM
jgi:histone-lysine N-methyltransferase SETMAR